MIAFVRGIVHSYLSDSVIVEANGIGYRIFCSLPVINNISSNVGEEVLIFTKLIHKEDSMTLYGFLSNAEKSGFEKLLKISGVGPKLALKILSTYDIEMLFDKIMNEDIKAITLISGIGPKMAKKIIFELKGVIPKEAVKNLPQLEKDIIQALVNLDYSEEQIIKTLNSIKPLSNNFETEFKKVLKILAGK